MWAIVSLSSTACALDTSGVGTSAAVTLGDADGSGGSTDATSVGSATTTSTTIESGDVTGDPPPSCVGGGSCGTAAPAGWTGPFAINTASPPNDGQQCPPGWDAGPVGGIDLVAPAATCACDCVPAPATCTVGVSYYSDAGCATAIEAGGSDGSCEDLATATAHGFVRAIGMPSEGACTPSEHYVVPPPTWATASVLCTPPEADPCADGPCMPPLPPGFQDTWCVVGDGDQACPAGPYSARTVMASGVDDTRACTPCGCSMQGPVQCAGEIVEYVDSFCIVPVGTVPIDGQCHAADVAGTDAWSVRYDGGSASYSCVNNQPMAVGEAIVREPMTICCTE